MLRTILFTDIEGSTKRWEEDPGAMQAALETHDRIVRQAFADHSADWWKGTGDGFAASFESPGEALKSALSIQEQLADTTWERIDPLRIRIGAHLGDVVERDDDRFGPTMNRAARIMSAAHGGQVIASMSVIDALGPTDLTIADLGRHRLKDLLDPTQLFQVDPSGAPARFPRLRSLPSHTNLPIDRSTFVGRENELETIAGLVETQRLVTLVGPGGVGKTRLANHAAAEVADAHPHGVWFIPLAAVTEPAVIADEAARVLGLLSEETAGPLEALRDHVATRQLLLVLDNCEHLIDAAAELVEDLLAVGPDLSVIATSREPLSINEERILRIEPLDTGPHEAAVQLFVDRATATGAQIDSDDPAIPRICQRLDGLALAIELAASKTRTLRLADLEHRLDNRFSLLQRSRGGPDHHQTLAATIDWSYELATPPERIVLSRLAVFNGLFSLHGAERVAGFGSLDELAVVEALERLVDRSLIAVASTDEAERYFLLESIKEFAAARLADSGDLDATQERLIEAVLDLVMTDPEPGSDVEAAWLGAMHRNAPTLRAALAAAERIPDPAALASLVIGAARYWVAAGFADEGIRWAQKTVDVVEPSVPLLETCADLYLAADRETEADAALDAAMQLVGDDLVTRARLIRKQVSRSSMVVNNLRIRDGHARLSDALALLGAPVPDWPDDRLREWINLQLDLAGAGYHEFDVDTQRAAIDAARPWLDRATIRQRVEFGIVERGLLYQETRYRPEAGLEVAELEFGGSSPANRDAHGAALFRTAFYELLIHDVESAHARLVESAEIAEQLGGSIRLARVYTYYSLACRRLGRIEECRSAATRGLAYSQQSAHPSYMAVAEANLAWCHLRDGDLDEAGALLEKSATALASRARRYPFHWIALLPLMELRASTESWTEVQRMSAALLEPEQQRLPDSLELALERLLSSSPESIPATTSGVLDEARAWRLL